MLAEKFARQLARPHGLVGRVLGGAMDIANRLPVQRSLDLLAARSEEQILDVGCGTGEAIRHLLDRTPCSVTGIDPSSAMIAAAKGKLGDRARLLNAALDEVDLSGSSFDAVLAINVLYFSDAEGAMLSAMHRLLRPGGRLVAYVSHRRTMEQWSFTRAGLHRLFDEEELTGALLQAGFAPQAISVQTSPVTRGVTGIWAVAYR